MTTRLLFVHSLIALVFVAHSASAGSGVYQRTKDGKSLVWNNYPAPGDAATWSGDRDSNGYATGHGTLVWYGAQRAFMTGSNIPTAKFAMISQYSGNMIRGKFDGMVVNIDANGKTFHGTFVDGRKGKDWARGPAPTSVASERPKEEKARDTAVEAPAEGPSPEPAQEITQQHIGETVAAETPKQAVDDSLQSLISPPSLLRMNRAAEPSPAPPSASITTAKPAPAAAGLSAEQAIQLANAEARAQGYDLGEYLRPQARYSSSEGNWSVVYDQKKDANGMDGIGKPFSVSVEDKTRKASIAGR